ncbi:hypothetical protein niasHT_036976 [Heterodera trifolii]|uniref:Uncharacterized protein n=1 Tax=Heterodera trifolii TaxID=157864 RepID=A0ABD2IXN9_9BILA
MRKENNKSGAASTDCDANVKSGGDASPTAPTEEEAEEISANEQQKEQRKSLDALYAAAREEFDLDMSPLDSAMKTLREGREIQKLSVLRNLVELVEGEPDEALHRLLPMMQVVPLAVAQASSGNMVILLVSNEINSTDCCTLLLPCIIQLCKDEDPSVREAILSSMAQCLPHFSKDAKKSVLLPLLRNLDFACQQNATNATQQQTTAQKQVENGTPPAVSGNAQQQKLRQLCVACRRITSAYQSTGLNSLAFQSPEINNPAFQLLGLKLSNPSAFQSLGLVSPILNFYHLDSTPGIPITGTLNSLALQSMRPNSLAYNHWNSISALLHTNRRDSILWHSNRRKSTLRHFNYLDSNSAILRHSNHWDLSHQFCISITWTQPPGIPITGTLNSLALQSMRPNSLAYNHWNSISALLHPNRRDSNSLAFQSPELNSPAFQFN